MLGAAALQIRPLSRSARIAHVIRLATGGVSVRDIAREFQMSRESVRYVLHVWGIRAIDPRRVDPERVIAAVRAVVQGLSVVDAAITHEVSHATLTRALKRHMVRASTTSKGRMNGSIARALKRVLVGRETVVAACQAERCSSPYIYTTLKRMLKSAR